jgi:hypothetical protein
MSVQVQLVAALITITLLGYAGAIALAGVQVVTDWRTPGRGAAAASLLQHGGAAIALLGLAYRYPDLGAVGLLLVMLSLLIADVRREAPVPMVEIGLTGLALANLLAMTVLLVL